MDNGHYNHSTNLESVWNSTESLGEPSSQQVIWPQWMDIVIPLACVLIFFVALLLIVVFPSRPSGEYKDSDSVNGRRGLYEALELRVIPPDSNTRVKMKTEGV